MKIIENENQIIDYIKDESQLCGNAERIILCHSSEEVVTVLRSSCANYTPITIQGALTGISGGAVPQGGDVLNLSELDKFLGMRYDECKQCYYVNVGAGMLLKDLNHAISSKHIDTKEWDKEDVIAYDSFCMTGDMFFPPDPTETEASIGGMVACDASGACSFLYGATRNYVESIRIITPYKDLHIKRGEYSYKDLPELLEMESVELPKLQPAIDGVKNVAGLYYKDNMDLIDLFIGSEGVLGVITEVEIKIISTPTIKMGIMLFFNKNNTLVDTVNYLKGNEIRYKPCAIEYFDKKTFEMLNEFRSIKPEINVLPNAPIDNEGGLYIEFHLDNHDQLDEAMQDIYEKFEEFDLNRTEQWVAFESSDYEKLKAIRHAVPECVNIMIIQEKIKDGRIRKVGTDMAVPDKYLHNVMKMYDKGIEEGRFNAIIFGHIGNNHLHVNFIPESFNEYESAVNLTMDWAEIVADLGGSVTAEHGIGKLKKALLEKMINKEELGLMADIKALLDPKSILNKGTLLQ